MRGGEEEEEVGEGAGRSENERVWVMMRGQLVDRLGSCRGEHQWDATTDDIRVTSGKMRVGQCSHLCRPTPS